MSASIEKCLAFADNDVCETKADVLPFVANNVDEVNEFSFIGEFVAEIEWF
jgi:hypothetical protein